MVIEPSDRSTMTCTVQPARPDTLTRTRRKPSCASTGTTIEPTRAAIPVSPITRGSPSDSLPVDALPVASLPVTAAPAFVFAAKVEDVIKRRVAVVSISCPAKLLHAAGNKKERVPGGAHSHDPI